mmetsp:Transcript_9868/g.19430  ORF Transcript_9868/g.19430 Transcript_9868/m.19430 type:complete len:82 (+) Transcript_9868:156-401(+)
MAKSTKGYKMIRVVTEAKIKPFLTPQQIQAWGKRRLDTYIEGKGKDGEEPLDSHTIALEFWNRSVMDKEKEMHPKKKGFFG